jgi:hypothetical protein
MRSSSSSHTPPPLTYAGVKCEHTTRSSFIHSFSVCQVCVLTSTRKCSATRCGVVITCARECLRHKQTVMEPVVRVPGVGHGQMRWLLVAFVLHVVLGCLSVSRSWASNSTRRCSRVARFWLQPRSEAYRDALTRNKVWARAAK